MINMLLLYLLSSFIISSYCVVSARKKIATSYPNIFSKLSNENIINMVQVSELKDSQNLVNVFNNSFFNKEVFTWEEYRNKFEDKNGFQWILSPRGIRAKLEQNNV